MRKTFLKKGLRELWSHRVKYLLFIIILSLGVSMFNTMYGFMETREQTVDNIYKESNFFDYQIQLQYDIKINKSTAENILYDSVLRDIIDDVEYRIVEEVFINHTVHGEHKLTKGQLIGYEYFYGKGQERTITVNNPLFFSKDPTSFQTTNELSCFLEVGFAQLYDFEQDNSLQIINNGKTVDLIVKEIINVPDYFVVRTNDMLFPDPSNLCVFIVPMGTAQDILFDSQSNELLINDIIIRTTSEYSIKNIKDEISSIFQSYYIPVEIIDKEDNPARYQLIEDIEGDKQLMGLFPLIIFSVSAIGLFISLRRMVQSHRPQIGVFKALGVPNFSVLMYFLSIGLIVAFAGISLGFLLTLPLNMAFQSMMDQMMVFAMYSYGDATQYMVTSGIIAILLCVFCTLLPSYQAVREKPIDVIQKHEGVGSIKKHKKKRVLLSSSLPIPIKIVSRDISRKPFRSFTTIFGVALALSFFLSVVILADSMIIFLDESKDANNWNYEISVSGFTSSDIRNSWLNEKDYISDVTYAIRLPANVSKNSFEKEVLIFAVSDLKETFNVNIDFVEKQGIYISQYVAENLQVTEHDWIEVELPVFSKDNTIELKPYTMEILGIHSNPLGLYIYADIDYIYQIINKEDIANVFYIHTSNGRIPQEIQNSIATTPGVVAVTYVLDQEKFLDDMFGIILGMIFMMIIISSLLMLAIIYNIFMINASEKNREYATMKTLGTSLKRISYLIFVEGFFTIIGGIGIGSIMGYYMAVGMLQGTDVLEGFTFDVVFSFQWFVIGALMVIIIVLLVSILTIRFINKIIIADVIRERTTG